jgi:hypothetical protein
MQPSMLDDNWRGELFGGRQSHGGLQRKLASSCRSDLPGALTCVQAFREHQHRGL